MFSVLKAFLYAALWFFNFTMAWQKASRFGVNFIMVWIVLLSARSGKFASKKRHAVVVLFPGFCRQASPRYPRYLRTFPVIVYSLSTLYF